ELQDTGVVMTKERPVTDTVFVVREKVIRERDTVFIIREVPVPDTAQMRKSLRDGKVLRELSGKLKVRSDSLRILKEDLVQLERDLMQPGQMVLPDTLFFTLYYDSDSFEARNREEIMQDIRDVTQHKKVVRIFVSGYTDSRGTPEVNLVISNRRVLAVSDQLRELGIDRRLIYNQHFGDAYASELPLDTDRRVDIVILAEDL
ncbi:MAG: OmpA family protein, partial [Bacteroidales bacterium]|nr:OmpA family protein [Bacteroidales bacterium]